MLTPDGSECTCERAADSEVVCCVGTAMADGVGARVATDVARLTTQHGSAATGCAATSTLIS